MSEIKLGDQLPKFSLKDQNGELVNSQSWLGQAVVIYFYPNDNTRICTAQACSFRNRYEEFQDLDARVVGISHNSVHSHSDFANKHGLPFTLLSDPNRAVSKLFGVPKALMGLSAGRVTYVFNQDGVLIYSYNAFMQAKEHIQAALDSLKG